ncbi:MAG: SDR family oxidoreductase [Bacteroidota bacterium]
MSQKILITGTSGGFGKLAVNTLLAKGHTVVASMRGTEGKNKASADELRAAGAHVVEMDVINDESVNKGVEQAIALAGGLDVLVNNAGVGVIGLQETFTPEDWQRVFEVNVFGVQRVNRAVIPHFRSQQSGLLIHVSSLLGRMTLPFYGPYNATKWALEAMAENYRVELSGFGIDSCIVEPGGFATSFMDNLFRPSDDSRNEGYGEMANAPQQLLEGFEQALASNPAQDPQNVADAIVDLAEAPAGQRPMRTVVDNMGMGDHIKGYNDQLEQIMHGIYGAFDMGDMLKVKTS